MGLMRGAKEKRRRHQRRLAWLMLVAILPSLTYLGHVSLHVDIPGTTIYLGMPEAAVHDHGSGAADDDHGRHCHADVASCTDVPFTGASAFALLQQAAAVLGATGLLTLLLAIDRQPARGAIVAPVAPPPRWQRA